MGTSGTAIFSDDTAADVRHDFVDLLRHGMQADEALTTLMRDWSSAIADADDGPVFWLAVAATASGYGCLTDDIKQRALAVIDDGADLSRWSGKQLDKRRAVLAELKGKLLGSQPKPRRPRKLKRVEPPPSHEVQAPDGRGKAVAFSMPDATFMQVYVEREVSGSRGGGGVFMASCAFDDVELAWLPGPVLLVTYPRGVTVHSQSSQNFYFGEVIPIVYQVKE
jgi:hypothetical protein